MKFNLETSAGNIVEFPNKEYPELNQYFQDLVKKLDIPNEVDDWTISYKLVMSGHSLLTISKRGITYSNDKEKEIYIGIPIPRESQIFWGLEDKRFCYLPPVELKQFYIVDINYQDYKSLDKYIIACGKRAILESLNIGFTLKGHKIIM